ncbi:MAG: hypothetical protein NC342_01415 [Pseudoflavonifractor sp.]|nr:hypothetical protein [Alloprevotella sp.]MCM1116183.1 hypothetical protein [Pseudoflavonifractor sp.]
MNKLSIFLSMIVAVAVAAFAASGIMTVVPSLSAANDGTQGYWFTLSQVQGDDNQATADAKDALRFFTVVTPALVGNNIYTQNAADNANPNADFYWHAETVTNADGEYYLKSHTGNYLTVSIANMKNEDGDSQYYYSLTVTKAQKDAATWEFNPTTVGENTNPIKLIGVPSGIQKTLDAIKPENGDIAPTNTRIAMAQANLTVQMVTENGTYIGPYDRDKLGEMTLDWTLKSAEIYFEEATDKASAQIENLIATGLITNAKDIETARAACQAAKVNNQDKLTTASSNPQSVITTATNAIATAYSTLFRNINNSVVTLGNLSTDGSTLSNDGAADQLASLWTIRTQSNNTITLENQISGKYIAYIPATRPGWDNATQQPIPAVPAHFGVASSPTQLSLIPQEDGSVQIYSGENPLAIYDAETNTNGDPVGDLTLDNLTAEEVAAMVSTGETSEFVTEKSNAVAFLTNLQTLAQNAGWPCMQEGTEEYDNFFAITIDDIEGLNPGSNSTNLTPVQILANAKQQMGMVASVTNRALVPVMLTDNNTTKFLAGYLREEQGWDAFGNEAIIKIPTAGMISLDGTAKSERLSGAIWAFEYVKDGKARIVNSEGIYLASEFSNEMGYTTNATEDASAATLFAISSDGQLTYTDKDGQTQTLSIAGPNDTNYDSFALANPVASDIETCTAEMDEEGVMQPDGTPNYYRIASIGAGGVITGLLPGDALTHTASAIGSYWWFERDDSDIVNENAYFIHSIFPGYYLGEDMTMSEKPCRWYVNANGISRPNNITLANVFNGFQAGLVINSSIMNNQGTAVTAAGFTANGEPNPAMSSSRYSTSNWRTANWMIVEAGDIDNIVNGYTNDNLKWQVRAAKDAFEGITSFIPFAANSLSAAISELDLLFPDPDNISSNDINEVLANVIAFNDIIARTQTEFDQEMLERAPGATVKLINEGRSYLDWSGDAYLSGYGSTLKFVPITDTEKASEWTIAANGTKGLTFRNGNNRYLGAPTANGSISSATGTYRLAIDFWWHNWEKDAAGNWVDKGTNSPWYAVPEGMDNEAFSMCFSHGLGLENVASPGIGLAAKGGVNELCGASLNNYYSQWLVTLYVPAPEVNAIETIEGDNAAAETALFNLQGIRVDRATAAPGIYISRRADGSAVKVRID